MRKLVDHILEDLSTRETFSFRLRCGSCGGTHSNRPVRFSKAGIPPATPEKQILFDAIYDQEYRSARSSAIRSIAANFNYCPICKRIVCNRCFLICEDLDMCAPCAALLEENGVPVLAGIPEITG